MGISQIPPPAGGGGGGGVTDHGALTGLSDDDHSIYALADGSRGTFEVSGAVAAHEADTTSVHGITDTSTLYRAGGTDVAVTDGGTGASNASGARSNLGLVIGTDVSAAVHVHAAADITSGVINAARLGTGTADTTTYLRGDGSWQVVVGWSDEQSQDAVGTILTDTATVDLTYNDSTPSITASVIADSIGPTQLADTAVTAGSYGTSSAIPSFTVDAQGRITAASTNAIADSPATLILARAFFK